MVPCNKFAELFARRFAFRILVYFCSCPADLQTTASRTADKCLVHLHREAGFVPKDTACIQQVSSCWLLLSQLCCTEFRCSWLRSWYRRDFQLCFPTQNDLILLSTSQIAGYFKWALITRRFTQKSLYMPPMQHLAPYYTEVYTKAS